MSKEEPAWKAELRDQIVNAFEADALNGPEDLVDLVADQIKAAEQRGFQAGVNKTGDSVGKLREQLKMARLDAHREIAGLIRGMDAGVIRMVGRRVSDIDVIADFIDPDTP
jgi:hypothetical protein